VSPAAADAVFLAALPGWAFAFILVLCRVSVAAMLMPGLGEAAIPNPIRIGIAVAMSVLVLPTVVAMAPQAPSDTARGLAMLAGELFFGLTLGWLARLAALALTICGQFIALMIGLSNVLNPDPDLGSQTAATARLLGMAAPVVVFASGLYALPLAALAQSYRMVPPGGFLPIGGTAQAVAEATSACFALALRLSGPFLLFGLLWQVAVGTLARLVPQMQVHFAMMPGQILAGIILLGLLGTYMLEAWQSTAHAAFTVLPGL
jgi:flagellar biosynthetic protein FliR